MLILLEEHILFTLLYFIYGLSFFLMGVAIFLKVSAVSKLRLASVLWLLAAFGITHGIHEWVQLFTEINKEYFSPPVIKYLIFANMVLVAVSFVFLFQFGADLFHAGKGEKRVLKSTPLLSLWILIVGLVLAMGMPIQEFTTYGEILTRYIIGFPGGLLAGISLISYSYSIEKEDIGRTIRKNLKFGGIFLILYSFFAGILGPQGSFFPASVINKASFLEFTSIPVELLRTISATGINYFIVTSLEVFDIETKKKIQAEVADKTREIRETKDLLENIIKSSMDGIITKDLDDNIISWNRGAQRILDYSEDDIIGKNYGILIPEDQNENLLNVEKALKGRGFVQNLDLQLLTKSGKRKPVNITSSYIKDSKGKVRGVTCIVRDLSKKRKMENQLIQADRLASLGLLGAGVAHQIKNPLGGILLSAESLQEKCSHCEKNKGAKKDIDNIINSVDIANKTVMELLEFSKETEHNLREVDLKKKVDKALRLISYKLKKIKVKKNFPGGEFTVNGDPLKLQQVFLNLLINSIQAMRGEGTLEIDIKENGDFYEVWISDTGYGIPEKNISRIFDPYFTTKKVGEGTGLGLSVALGVVERHNGYINVKSKEGIGTTFIVGIPGKED